VIYPGSEDDHAATVGARVLIALSGPVWSLVSGAIVLALPQLPASRGFWRIAVLWFGLLSVQEFSGYLMVGLFTHVGDIGAAYEQLGTPLWVELLVFAVGVFVTYLNGKIATRRLLELTNPSGDVGPQLRSLGLFAWLLGAAMVILISVPTFLTNAAPSDVPIFELLGTLSSGTFLFFVRIFMRRLQVDHQRPTFDWPILGIVALVVVALIRVVVFGPGLTL